MFSCPWLVKCVPLLVVCSGACVRFRLRLLWLALDVVAFLAELLTKVTHVHIWQHLLDGGCRCISAIPTLLNKYAKPILHMIHRDLFSVLKLQILTAATELSLDKTAIVHMLQYFLGGCSDLVEPQLLTPTAHSFQPGYIIIKL